MSRAALIVALLAATPFVSAPVSAQSETEELQEGFDLLSEGARRLLEELTEDLAPLLRQLELQIEELQAYEAPEILPNGDILIRRKPDPDPAPEADPPAPDSTDPIDL